MNENTLKYNKAELLLNAGIPRLTLRFALTTLIALLLNSIYNLTDTLFVSWGVGDSAMGGVSVVFPFVILQGAISTAVGGGAASIVSRKLGEGRLEEAGAVTVNAMLAFYLTAAVTTALGLLLMDPLLSAMGVNAELYPYAKQYFTIILAGNIFSTGFSSIIRAEGRMIYSLLIWVIPISLNIILDAVFILGFKWGVAGSAAATVLCQMASFTMCVLFFTRFSCQRLKGAKFSLKKIGSIFAIGLPSLVQMGSFSIMTALLNNVIRNAGGTLAVAAFAYVGKLSAFALVPFTALAQALAPIAGYNYGAGNYRRVKESLRFSLTSGLIYAVCALIVLEAMPTLFMRIFTASDEVISIGSEAIRIIAMSLIFAPFPMLTGAMLQAIGSKAWALIMYSLNLIFLIPLALIMTPALGLPGVWWAYAGAAALSGIFALIKALAMGRKLQLNPNRIIP